MTYIYINQQACIITQTHILLLNIMIFQTINLTSNKNYKNIQILYYAYYKFNLSCLNFVIFICFLQNFDSMRNIIVSFFTEFIVFTIRRRKKKKDINIYINSVQNCRSNIFLQRYNLSVDPRNRFNFKSTYVTHNGKPIYHNFNFSKAE